MPRLSRRKLMLFGPLAVAAGGATVSAGLYAANDPTSVIAGIVRRYFPETDIPAPMLQEFAGTFARVEHSALRVEFNLLRVAAPFLESDQTRTLLPARAQRKLEIFDRIVVTRFIQSTDFLAEYDQGRNRVTSMTYWDPVNGACVNPLVRWT